MLKIAVAGASGRMGRMLVQSVLGSGDCTLAGALDIPGSPALGQDAGAFLGQPTGVTIRADLHAAIAGSDVLIDFTRPEGTLATWRCATNSVSRPSSAPPASRRSSAP